MTILTVGAGQEFSTIEAAVKASHSGDTIDVQAGTYKNDFLTIDHSLTITAVGGTVNLVATKAPPSGNAVIDEGGAGTVVSITGFDISGASSGTGNAAAIRYEGGTFTLDKSTVHGNQQGFTGVADKNGMITIENSTFSNNGNGGANTSNIYAANVSQIIIENSTITAPNGGSNIVSRAAQSVITDDIITDGPNGTGKYAIDLPIGGNVTISGDVIEKGPKSTGPVGISFGESGSVYGSSSLGVQNSTIVNDLKTKGTTAVSNNSTVTASIDQNKLYGWTNTSSGPAFKFLNSHPSTEPALTSQTAGNKTNAPTTGTAGGTLLNHSASPAQMGLTAQTTAQPASTATIPTQTGGSASSLIALASQTSAMQFLHHG